MGPEAVSRVSGKSQTAETGEGTPGTETAKGPETPEIETFGRGATDYVPQRANARYTDA